MSVLAGRLVAYAENIDSNLPEKCVLDSGIKYKDGEKGVREV